MKYRKLRIAWSVFWGAVTVLLIALCIRSYWWMDEFSVRTKVRITRVDSNYGKLLFATEAPVMTGEFVENWGVWSGDAMRNAILPPMPEYSALGFSAATTGAEGPGFAVGAPTWFPIVAFAAFAATPWLRQLRWRFSLRILLTATTLVAVMLGLVLAVLRWPAG